MASLLNNPCDVYETANCKCRVMPSCAPCVCCVKPKPPCKIFMPPKPKPGVCEDLRRLNFFNVVGNILTFLAMLLFLLTLLELLVFHYLTTHGEEEETCPDCEKDYAEMGGEFVDEEDEIEE